MGGRPPGESAALPTLLRTRRAPHHVPVGSIPKYRPDGPYLPWLAPLTRVPTGSAAANASSPHGKQSRCFCEQNSEASVSSYVRVLDHEFERPDAKEGIRSGKMCHGDRPTAPIPLLRRVSAIFMVVVRMFSGPHRLGDLHDEWQPHGLACGIIVFVEGYDLQLASKSPGFDFLSLAASSVRASRGEISWLAGGAPCGTWSAARYAGPPGPPPIRSRSGPWGLPNLTVSHARSIHIGNTLIARFVDLCRPVGKAGGFFLKEHPEDRGRGRDPYPSIWTRPPSSRSCSLNSGGRLSLSTRELWARPTRREPRWGASLGLALKRFWAR